MSPHERMSQLDAKGETYTVKLSTNAGRETAVYSHTEEWIEVEDCGKRLFVNLAHVTSLQIIEE